MNTLKYKNFIATIQFSEEDEAFIGRIEGINSVVSFEGQSVSELKKSFKDAVYSYLEFCKEKGLDAHKSYTGVFNVRVTPDIHRQAALFSMNAGTTLNNFIKRAIENELKHVHA